ncbi:MAG TPA: ATP-binding protein [Opitutus sp.]|nr:ATP-binding protein [Opitutus sp.]
MDRVAPPAPASPTVAAKIDGEMTRVLYRTAGFGLFSNFVLAILLAVGAASSLPWSLHVAWLSSILVISIGRLALLVAFERARPPLAALGWWRTAFLVGLTLAAVAWGAAGWFYLAAPSAVAVLLGAMILMGLNAGAARTIASVPLAYRIYIVATLGPALVRFTSLPDSGWLLAMMTFTYALFITNTANLHYNDLRRQWQLIFENEALVETLRIARDNADAANRAKGDFLATMSHEIRTPMNGIIGMLQLLQGSPLTSAQREQLAIAGNSADTLMRLLNDILDFSKIESGKLEMESVPFPLAPVVEGVAALLRPRAAEKGLILDVDLPADIPAYVTGDSARLKQVLLNLTGNAVKFTDRGRVIIAVAMPRGDDHGATLRFTITDTGIGIDQTIRPKLFQVFTQGDSSMNRRFGGSGLGLAISQRLVQSMGGEISVESTPGEGSRFKFELKFAFSSAPVADARPAGDASPALLSGHVLIVEDDRVNQRVIELMLSRLGLTCHLVDNGAAGAAAARTGHWDAIIMDCQLPGMDGLEATRQIRSQASDGSLPIIALTANVRAEDRAACLAAGMSDFLTKPVRQEELRACLEKWLASAPAR